MIKKKVKITHRKLVCGNLFNIQLIIISGIYDMKYDLHKMNFNVQTLKYVIYILDQ